MKGPAIGKKLIRPREGRLRKGGMGNAEFAGRIPISPCCIRWGGRIVKLLYRTTVTIFSSVGLLVACAHQSPMPLPSVAPQPAMAHDSTEVSRALHVLNRLAYGARPGDVDRVLAIGIDRYIDQQLHGDRIPDQGIDQRLKAFEVLRRSPADLAHEFRQAQQERQREQRLASENR